ncbi:hypothetical protein ACLOJK_036958 [Asimina triloba]
MQSNYFSVIDPCQLLRREASLLSQSPACNPHPSASSPSSAVNTVSQTSHHPPASCHSRSRPPVVLLIADLLSWSLLSSPFPVPFSSSSYNPSAFSPFSHPLAVHQRQRPPSVSSPASSPRRPSSVTSPASSVLVGSHGWL